ncbi:hypothetical protein I5F79_20215, partial [Pseudomonas aeruginosa]|nr:hypothetical protein [Pseudomonas aeruginosa]
EEAAGVCLAITEEDDPQALPPRLDVQRLLRGPGGGPPPPPPAPPPRPESFKKAG